MATSADFLKRAYALKNVNDAQTFYDEWASNYDAHMDELGYHLPVIAASAVPQYGDIKGKILDAGCGTGLVGRALGKLGASTIDGLDISPGMLERARATGAYRNLQLTDLTQHLPFDDGTYEALVCSGTLTHGHVGPRALAEFVRVVKVNGIVAATVIDDLWKSLGYEAEVGRLVDAKEVEVLSTDQVEFRKEKNVHVRLVVLRKL